MIEVLCRESRVIDLSYAAARILGFRGVAPVRLDLVDPHRSARLKSQNSAGPRNFRDDRE